MHYWWLLLFEQEMSPEAAG